MMNWHTTTQHIGCIVAMTITWPIIYKTNNDEEKTKYHHTITLPAGQQ